jgi:hypothetical protein
MKKDHYQTNYEAFIINIAARIPKKLLTKRVHEFLAYPLSRDARDILKLMSGDRRLSKFRKSIIGKTNKLLISVGKPPITEEK